MCKHHVYAVIVSLGSYTVLTDFGVYCLTINSTQFFEKLVDFFVKTYRRINFSGVKIMCRTEQKAKKDDQLAQSVGDCAERLRVLR